MTMLIIEGVWAVFVIGMFWLQEMELRACRARLDKLDRTKLDRKTQ